MNFQIKNKISLILALFLAILQIILMKELFQMGIAEIFGAAKSSFQFNFPSFSYYFEPVATNSLIGLMVLYFSPYIYIISSVEISSILLKKVPLGGGRFFLLIFILLQIGYMLVHIFYSAVILILNPGIQNDWIALSLYWGLSDSERFIFAFGVIFLFVFYLNMSTKRLLKYINY